MHHAATRQEAADDDRPRPLSFAGPPRCLPTRDRFHALRWLAVAHPARDAVPLPAPLLLSCIGQQFRRTVPDVAHP